MCKKPVKPTASLNTPEEYFEILGPDGTPTGQVKLRRDVHRDGDWHKTVHIWVRNRKGELLLQKRSLTKESHPGLWDISAAGHIAAGEDPLPGACRELEEELGLVKEPSQLRFLFSAPTHYRSANGAFVDNEITQVFLTDGPDTVNDLVFGRDEVDEIAYVHPQEIMRRLDTHDPTLVPHTTEYQRLFALLGREDTMANFFGVRKGTKVWIAEESFDTGPLPMCGERHSEAGCTKRPPSIPPQTGGRRAVSTALTRQCSDSNPLPACGEGQGGAIYTNSPSLLPLQTAIRKHLVPIESVTVGMRVCTHEEKIGTVTKTCSCQFSGRMIGITHDNCDSVLWLTANHKVLAIRRPRSLGGASNWTGVPRNHFGRAQEFRKNMTPPERILWRVLRHDGIGYTFRRQHPIGHYIADFYCRECSLVVEVDGAAAHGTVKAQRHDAIRDAIMKKMGLTILRIPAKDVFSNIEGVALRIDDICRKSISIENAGWFEACRLGKEDIVFYGIEPTGVKIKSISVQITNEAVFDLEVEDGHSFITQTCAIHDFAPGNRPYSCFSGSPVATAR